MHSVSRAAATFAAALAVAAPAAAQLEFDISPRDAVRTDPDGEAPIDDPLTCLARTIYWESRGEGDEGMRAVAYVVLNRVAAEDRPDRICAVIKEGGEAPPCQFNWWCDGRPDDAGDEEEYARAREAARLALNGELVDPTGGATMFHHRGVSPGWAAKATPTAEIGDHIFYRLD